MRCGNCKGNHDAVAEVRACYGARPSVPYPSRGARPAPTSTPSPAPVRVARDTLDVSNVPVGTRDGYGHYAVKIGDELRFFRVDKPTSGKWKGWCFVKHEVSEQTFPVATIRPDNSVTWKTPALQPAFLEVVANPKPAAELYGELFTRCALCNIRLTDPKSIERKIGPDCASNAGW